MRNDTPITVIGNLTDDPELRFTPGGDAVCKFTVAHNPRVRDNATGEWKDGEPSFHNCTAWRQQAENIAESLRRGTRVVVVGSLRQRKWEGKDGETRWSWEVTVDAIGPDLSWATATVRKMARNSNGDVPPGDEWLVASKNRPDAVTASVGASDEPGF